MREFSVILDFHEVRCYLTIMKTKISSKGQIVLPAEIREQDDIEPGQQFKIERIDRGEYRLVREEPTANRGLVEWLLACPVKGFFTPFPRSQTTDTLFKS